MISAPNVEWITCVNGVLGENIGGSTAPRFLHFADNTIAGTSGTIPTLGIAIDCKLVRMSLSYMSNTDMVFADPGALTFTLGKLLVNAPAIATNFAPIEGAPEIVWDRTLNDTHPTTFVDLDVSLKAQELLCMRSVRSGTMVSDTNAEVSVSLWFRGSTDPNSLPIP